MKHYAIKAYGKVDVQINIFLTFALQLDAPTASSAGKEPPLPIEEKAGWDPESVRTIWRRENIFP
jgi:hypothetical protein